VAPGRTCSTPRGPPGSGVRYGAALECSSCCIRAGSSGRGRVLAALVLLAHVAARGSPVWLTLVGAPGSSSPRRHLDPCVACWAATARFGRPFSFYFEALPTAAYFAMWAQRTCRDIDPPLSASGRVGRRRPVHDRAAIGLGAASGWDCGGPPLSRSGCSRSRLAAADVSSPRSSRNPDRAAVSPYHRGVAVLQG